MALSSRIHPLEPGEAIHEGYRFSRRSDTSKFAGTLFAVQTEVPIDLNIQIDGENVGNASSEARIYFGSGATIQNLSELVEPAPPAAELYSFETVVTAGWSPPTNDTASACERD